MAVVDFTLLEGLGDTGAAATKAIKTGYPLAGGPVKGIKHDFYIKVAANFAKTNLTDGDWKIFTIPANMYVFDILTVITKVEAADCGLVIGDASANHDTTWITAQTGQVIDIAHKTLVADANGATRGKFYPAGGALYCSATSNFDTLAFDLYIHAVMLDDSSYD